MSVQDKTIGQSIGDATSEHKADDAKLLADCIGKQADKEIGPLQKPSTRSIESGHGQGLKRKSISTGTIGADKPDESEIICKFFARGDCHFGSRCKNKHEGRAKKRRLDFVDSPSLHTEGKTFATKSDSICRFYLRGDCKFGQNCKAYHPGHTPTPTLSLPTIAPVVTPLVLTPAKPGVAPHSSGKQCRFDLLSKCKYGARCRDLHGPIQTTSETASEHQMPAYQAYSAIPHTQTANVVSAPSMPMYPPTQYASPLQNTADAASSQLGYYPSIHNQYSQQHMWQQQQQQQVLQQHSATMALQSPYQQRYGFNIMPAAAPQYHTQQTQSQQTGTPSTMNTPSQSAVR